MVTTKNKVKLKKPFGVFTDVGETCDVESINDGVVTVKLWDGHTFACMLYKEFEEHFEVIPTKTWSEWATKEKYVTFPNGEMKPIQFSYRSDGKRVQVRYGNFRAKSSCSPCDDFDLRKGINIAFWRLAKKLIAKHIDERIKREY